MRTVQHICITDDDLDDYYLFKTGLREVNESIKLTHFSCCSCLLSYLQSSNSIPDLIVLDMNMPEINGYECLLKIKRLERVSDTPVIIYSTSGDPVTIRRAEEGGATKYIIKPYTLELIKDCIRELIMIPLPPEEQGEGGI